LKVSTSAFAALFEFHDVAVASPAAKARKVAIKFSVKRFMSSSREG
jgi:hypothetical protein